MTERIVTSAWNLSLLVLVLACAVLAVALAYGAMVALLAVALAPALGQLFAAVTLTALLLWIARHREELAEW